MEETFNIDIVEDDEGSVRALTSMLARYGKEAGVQFTVRTFADGFAFICDYDGSADVVFMDIEMPNLNGLDAAKKLRRVDGSAVLVFITNLAQYAINGYEVDATDFIVKPLAWPSFSLKLKKILHTCARRRAASVRLDTQEGQVVLERGETITPKATSTTSPSTRRGGISACACRWRRRKRPSKTTTSPAVPLPSSSTSPASPVSAVTASASAGKNCPSAAPKNRAF